MISEIEETLRRIQDSHSSVLGVIVTNSDGVTLRSTVADASANYAVIVSQIVEKAKMALKDNDELTFLKIRTKKIEFIVVPDKDYILITLLNPSNESNA